MNSPPLRAICRRLPLLLVAAGMVLPGGRRSAFAQPPSLACPPSFVVSSSSAQELSLADVDFEHFQSSTVLFSLQVANRQDSSISATLRIQVSIELADRAHSFPNAVDFQSEPFAVPPGGRTVTNLNIGASGDIHSSAFLFDEQAKQYLKDGALATGTLPAGTYTFHFTVAEPSLCPNSTGVNDVVLVLTNPTRVELRSPSDGEQTNEFPLFEFYQESDRAVLTVAEKVNDQPNEDAITRQPPMIAQELSGGQNSFLYAGGRPLEIGKTYVWQVVSKVRGAGGSSVDVAGPIWSFSVSGTPGAGGPGGGPSATKPGDAILNQLEEIFGRRYPALFREIHAGGFSFTGTTTLNGGALSQSDLLRLIHQLRELGDNAEVSFE